MPVTLSVATVIELDGRDHLPDELKQLMASVEADLTADLPAVPEGQEEPGRDFGSCHPLADKLMEMGEDDLAAAMKWVAKKQAVPTRVRERWDNHDHFYWSDLPTYLHDLRFKRFDSFPHVLVALARELRKVREEMGL